MGLKTACNSHCSDAIGLEAIVKSGAIVKNGAIQINYENGNAENGATPAHTPNYISFH